MRTFVLLVRTTWLAILTEARYPVEYIVSLVTMAAILVIILLSGRGAGLNVFDRAVTPVVLNLILMEAISACTTYLEKRGRHAEETYSWPLSLEAQLFVTGLSSVLKAAVTIGLLYSLVSLFANLPFSGFGKALLFVVPLFVATMGLGYFLAGMQLIMKRVRSLASIVNMVFFGSTFLPVSWLGHVSTWLPFTTALKAIQGQSLQLLPFFSSCIIFLLMGLIAFRYMRNLTIRYGLAGSR